MTRFFLFGTLFAVALSGLLQAQPDSTQPDTAYVDHGAADYGTVDYGAYVDDSAQVYSEWRSPPRPSLVPLVVFGAHAGEATLAEVGGGIRLTTGRGAFWTGFGFTGSLLGGSDNEVVGGAELSAWLYSIVVLGASIGYYTDFEEGGFVFYPQIGIGLPMAYLGIRFTVAGQPVVPGMNTAELMIRFPFPLE